MDRRGFEWVCAAMLLLAAGCRGGKVDSGVSPSGAVGFYGSALAADDLANLKLGTGDQYEACFRWRAQRSGSLTAIRPFFIWSATKPGYHAGTGGTIRIQLQPDDGTDVHLPSGTVLATIMHADPVHLVDPDTFLYPLLTFPQPVAVQEGKLYHLLFTNVDADPANNWVSVNCAWQQELSGAEAPVQPTVSRVDLAILARYWGSTWRVIGVPLSGTGPYSGYTPILELDYADGFSQGQGYMEFWRGNPKLISGDRAVRQIFTVTGPDRTAQEVWVRVRPVSGTGPLQLRLETGDGALIEQVDVRSVPTVGGSGASWAGAAFSSPRVLASGKSYCLVLKAPADTVYEAWAIREGSDKGFKAATVFTDGHAQLNDGTGWTGWEMWGQTNRKDGDLQFYFTVRL